MDVSVVILLVVGVVVLAAGLYALGEDKTNELKAIKPARRRLDSRAPRATGTSVSAKSRPKKEDDTTSQASNTVATPASDPFDRVTTDGETPQARSGRQAAQHLADTDPAKLVHIIRKWRQEDEGRKFR